MKDSFSRAETLIATAIAVLCFSLVSLVAPAVAQESDEQRLQQLRDQLQAAEEKANALRAELYSGDSTRERVRAQARAEAAAARQYERQRDHYADLLMARAGALALMPQRARIGVTVRTRADGATDEIGAFLEEVTPDGPADMAGLESGDIVTHWNGESLLESPDVEDTPSAVIWSGTSEAASAPATRLIARSRGLEPEETVNLTYLRGGTERTAEVTARAMPSSLATTPPSRWSAPTVPVAPRAPRALRSRGGSDYFVLALGGPWGDMEVVAVGEELGEYFGTDRGLLVVDPPSEDPFGLRPGDVILSIGDREPRDLSHALRILRSYEPEETVNLTIQRKGKSVTLSGELPESADLFGRAPVIPGVLAPTAPAPPI